MSANCGLDGPAETAAYHSPPPGSVVRGTWREYHSENPLTACSSMLAYPRSKIATSVALGAKGDKRQDGDRDDSPENGVPRHATDLRNASHVLHTSAGPSRMSQPIGTSSSNRNALNLCGSRRDRARTSASASPRCHSPSRGGRSMKSTPSMTGWGQTAAAGVQSPRRFSFPQTPSPINVSRTRISLKPTWSDWLGSRTKRKLAPAHPHRGRQS